MVYTSQQGTPPPDMDVWKVFAQNEHLSEIQLSMFKQYSTLLQEWNTKVNLTRIDSTEDIISYHFQDSLAIRNFVDLYNCKGVVDVGTGAGFPGVPLAIVYPLLPVVLLEVNKKKIAFLEKVLSLLQLSHVSVCDADWRTFVRTTNYPIDYIFARASLQPQELVRAFKASSPYCDATIVYWASYHWRCPKTLQLFFKKEEKYAIKGKKRRFIFLVDTP